MSKGGSSEICRVASNVVFNFVEGQEMHSSITIQNLVDRIVSFKIKTNKPGIYLVKPMDGQIFNRSALTVHFKRKELTPQNFAMIQNNPGQAREKFLIELTSPTQEAVGVSQKCEQLAYLGVAFTKLPAEQKQPERSAWKEGKVRRDKLLQKQPKTDFDSIIDQKHQHLHSLIVERQALQATTARASCSKKAFGKADLARVLLLALLMGFVIL